MEGVAPPLRCVLKLRLRIESGDSMRLALRSYLEDCDDEFARRVRRWCIRVESEGASFDPAWFPTPLQRAVGWVCYQGLKGEPVLTRLSELEDELIYASHIELERFLQVLPVRALLPVMLLQMPALMILVLGPILLELKSHL